MEIETSFFRGPLLTSPSHISVGESVPGPCSEERGHPSCLLAGGTGGAARDLTAPECPPCGRPGLQPGSGASGAGVFLMHGTDKNLSNLSLSPFLCAFNIPFLSVWKHQVPDAAENEGSCQKSERKEKIQGSPQQRRSRTTTVSPLSSGVAAAASPPPAWALLVPRNPRNPGWSSTDATFK